jgi:hypothetical protein
MPSRCEASLSYQIAAGSVTIPPEYEDFGMLNRQRDGTYPGRGE